MLYFNINLVKIRITQMPPRKPLQKKNKDKKTPSISRSKSENQRLSSTKNWKPQVLKAHKKEDQLSRHTKFNEMIKDQHNHFKTYIKKAKDNNYMYYYSEFCF